MKSLHPKIAGRSTARYRSFMAQPFKSDSGIYQLRRKVPSELRNALGHEYKRSLKTRDPAEAKARFAEEWAASEVAFARARLRAAGEVALTEQDIQRLAARWFRVELQKLEKSGKFSGWLVEGVTWAWEQGDHRDEHTEYVPMGDALNDGLIDDADLDEAVERAVTASLRASGIAKPGDAATWSQLVRAFRDHWLQLSQLALARYQGDWALQPKLIPDAPVAGEVDADQGKRGGKLLALFELYAADKKLNDGDTRGVRKTLDTYKATLVQFIELCGDLPITGISREVVRKYRASLAQMPSKGGGIRKLSAKQLLSKAEMEGLPVVSAATVRNKLRALSAVLSHALSLGMLSENPVIAGGIGRAAAKAAGERAVSSRRAKGYTKDELRRIFSSAIFSDAGWSAPRADFGRAWYWMPLLMYYTGARREELAQLAARDVMHDADGIPFISILAMADDDDAGRGVKTAGSRRVIPLHPDLLERGFMEYVKSVPPEGQLFPKLVANPSGYYGANFGKRWAVYLREVISLASTASPSHGFRHAFKTLCREVDIPEDVHDAITGHSGGGPVARDYGVMPLVRMHAEIGKFPAIGVL